MITFWPRASESPEQGVVEKMQEHKQTVQGKALAAPSPNQQTNRTTGQPSQTQQEKRQELVKKIEGALSIPIEFYGKVVDQFDRPVSGAMVDYRLLDKFNASGSIGHTKADDQGMVKISGVRGASISVSVYKEGYYSIQEASSQSFAYGVGADAYTKSPPPKDNPAVFVLHKMGETAALVFHEARSARVPKNGTPAYWDFAAGIASSNGQLKVEAWTNDQALDEQKRYDWKCRISIPGGGLQERTGQFDFEAPSDGYRAYEEVSFTRVSENWKHRFNKEYFAMLPDGTYARFKFWFTTGGNHFFEVESHLNPTRGSRNLEFDPAKAIKP
jgi:hypothetical protein